MPKINTIAIVPIPKLSDKLVGTSVGGTPVNQTNNFTLQQLKTLFDGTPTSPTLQAVLNAGNTATQNIYLTGTIDTVNLDVSNDSFLKNLYLSERLFDKNNFQGTSGQYLTSTGTGVQWSTLTIATPTLQQVLTAGNISDKNIITTGNIQAANIQGTNITANTNLSIVGTLSDSSNSVGGSGQVLSSTVTGTDWIDFPSYSAVSPLIYNNVLKQFSIQVATSTQNGYLSAADWITFNGKQNAGNYITALTGEASALGPGSVNITLNNLAVINKTLTGLAIASGVITAADSIITAFGKIQGQINGIVAGVVYQGVWNAATNTPTLTSSVGVQGHYYVVDVAGNTNLNGITDWQVGDWAIYNGTAWQKVDNTDSVTSVNGQTGIVVLNSDDIAEGTTNLYYLDSRARAAISSVATGLTYTSATGVFSLTAGYSIPTNSNQTNWTTAYNDSIVSAAVTGTTTKTLTLTQQDGGTITASWTDIDTNLVTSVFGRTGAVVAQAGDYSTTLVTEGTNLYYLDSRARSAISSSATGLTYTTATGVFSFTAGYSIPTDASQSNWTTAYNDSIISAAVTGTTTKTLTLNQQDGGTITASWTDLDSGLTSVGVSMPSAFNVTNSPLTSNGTIAVTGAGTAAQYVRGDGTLGDFPTGGGGGGASVSYYLNGSINQGTFGGNTYYQMSKTPILGTGTDFSTSVNGYIAQFITDVGTPDALLIPGGNWNFETYFSASSGGGSPTFYIELYKYDGATFTLIASNSSNPELIAFGSTINPYYNSLAVPETILLATDRLAIRIHVFTSGRTITLHTENSHLCQAITTFTTGLTALNGLTKQIQYFAIGTSGTDFNISSSVATHTFNLPTASAVNRGALSSSDWSTFNGKQNALTLTTSGSSGPATLVGATLNIPDYGSALSGYVPYTGASQAVNLGIYSLSAGSLFVNGPAPTSGSYLGFKQATSVTTGGGGYTSISTFGTSQMNFSFAQPSGFKEFKFDVSSITTGVPGGRVYTMPDADGTIALVGGSGVGTVTSVAALTLGTSGTDLSSTVANSTTTPVITLNVPTASATNRGALSAADWSTFNAKQNALTLTTTGTSGAATLVGATLNIPQYQAAGTYVNSVTASSPLFSSGGVNPNITIQQASGSQSGFLSSTDWSTFNSKQNAITLTTTGTSGAATLVGSTLNIPQYQSVLTNPITGTGTTNYLPKFTGSTTIGNSQIIEGTNTIGINTTGYTIGAGYTALGINNATNGGALDLLLNDVKKGELYITSSSFNMYGFAGVGINLTVNNDVSKNLSIATTGNVLIGTTTDNGARLQVSGFARFDRGTLQFTLNPSYAGGNVYSQLQSTGALALATGGDNNRLYIDTSGNVGIGTSSPTFRFDVETSNLTVGRFWSNASGKRNNILIQNSANWNYGVIGVVSATGSSNGDVYGLGYSASGSTAFTEVLNWTSTGNVGIGTSSPSTLLHLQNSLGPTLRLVRTSNRFDITADNDFMEINARDASTYMIFKTADTERMRITSGGDIIGYNSFRSLTGFNLYKGSVTRGGMYDYSSISGSGTDYSTTIFSETGQGIYFAGNGSATRQMTLTSSGNLLVGTTTDNGARLQVSGTATFSNLVSIAAFTTSDLSSSTQLSLTRSGNQFTGIAIRGSVLADRAIFSLPNDDALYIGRHPGGVGAWTRQVAFLDNGNVLIGTTTDNGARLQVSGGGTFSDTLIVSTANASNKFQITSTTGTNAAYQRFTNSGGNYYIGPDNSAGTALFVTGGVAYGFGIVTESAQSIVLGTNNIARLTIAHTTGAATFSSSVTAGGTLTANTGTGATFRAVFGGTNVIEVGNYNATDGYRELLLSGSPISFYTSNAGASSVTERMRISSSGNVGIGTSSPSEKLDINSTMNLNGAGGCYASIQYNASTRGYWGTANAVIASGANNDFGISATSNLVFGTGGSYTERMRITSGGNVLIGTTTDAGYTLNVAGNAQIIKSTTSTALVAGLSGVTGSIIRFSYNGSFVGSISTDGSTTAYNTSSDYRLKEELRPIDNPLQKVLSLNPVNFKYKNSKTRQDGFIAHEIQEILPYLVTGEKDGEQMQEVDYSKLTPILIAAIKEQQKQIEELKNKVS